MVGANGLRKSLLPRMAKKVSLWCKLPKILRIYNNVGSGKRVEEVKN